MKQYIIEYLQDGRYGIYNDHGKVIHVSKQDIEVYEYVNQAGDILDGYHPMGDFGIYLSDMCKILMKECLPASEGEFLPYLTLNPTDQ